MFCNYKGINPKNVILMKITTKLINNCIEHGYFTTKTDKLKFVVIYQ